MPACSGIRTRLACCSRALGTPGAGYLDSREVGEILRDARDVARRRPELLVGTLFFAGLLLGRFLRSSAPEEEAASAEVAP
jgi:hypothetical protein